MPKMKTKRAAAKRFKKTGSGALKRFHANHSHILTKKSSKRKRNLSLEAVVDDRDLNRALLQLPYPQYIR